jgi:D-sedoheptulose 7-phosphate isomerase
MESLDYTKEYLKNSFDVKEKLMSDDKLLNNVALAADILTDRYRDSKKLLLAGNGGSAADAQHIAAEFVSRFYYDRPGLPAIALTTDSSMLTAIGNDYSFENIFSRQIQAQGNHGDVFIGISTSGNSNNIIKAVEAAKEENIFSIIFCGSGGALKDLADLAICVPSASTPHIQECHICIAHIICAIVEKNIFPRNDNES